MAQFKIDSWNTVQLARLRDFFQHEAKAGDTVIFDRKLAEENALSHEGLNDDDCNSWVYRAANQALSGLDDEKIQTLADTITLTTAYLHTQYPEGSQRDMAPPIDEAPEEDEYLDLDFEPDVLEREEPKPDRDEEAEEWARIVARHTKPKTPAH